MEDALVVNFEQNVVPLFLSELSFPRHFHQNRCFRAAVLALSAGMLKLEQVPPAIAQETKSRVGLNVGVTNWTHYHIAVRDLNEQLKQPEVHKLEELAGAALLLA